MKKSLYSFKILILSSIFIILNFTSYSQTSQGIGTNAPNRNAVLDVNSSGGNKGLLVPRMSTSQRTAITGLGLSEKGLIVFDTTSPTNAPFVWDGTAWQKMTFPGGVVGTINYIPKWSSSTSLSPTSLLYDNGVGVAIGSSNPAGAILRVSGSDIYFDNVTGGISMSSSALGNGYSQQTYNTGGGATGNPSYKLSFSPRSNNNSGTNEYAYVKFQKVSGSDQNDIFFNTSNSAGTVSEIMRLSGNGYVGIGTDSPATNMHIYRNGSPSLTIEGVSSSNSSASLDLITLGDGTKSVGSVATKGWRIGASNDFQASPGKNRLSFVFWTGSSGSGKLYLTSSGNLGVGAFDPKNTIDVNGAAVIGNSYANTNTAPTNGLLVEGSVGIGTTSLNSDAKLHLVGSNFTTGTSSGVFLDIQNKSNTTNALSGIRFTGSLNSAYLKTAIIVPYSSGSFGVSDMIFALNGTFDASVVSPANAVMILKGQNSNVGIGTSAPDSDALLELNSTSKGFLPPRMTTAQRNAITTPPNGLVIYNTSINCLEFYRQSYWASTCGSYAYIFTDSYITATSASPAQILAFNNYRAGLAPGNYNSVSISGSLDKTGVSCSDPVVTNQLAGALKNNTTVSLVCGANTWVVGPCGGGQEISVNNGTSCSCSSGFAIRPQVASNWGGIGTTCNAASQTLNLVFE